MAVFKLLDRQETLFCYWKGSISLLFFFPLLLSILIFFPSISVSSSEREGAINVSNCVWLASEEENVIVALLQQILKDVQYLPLGFRLKNVVFLSLFFAQIYLWDGAVETCSASFFH